MSLRVGSNTIYQAIRSALEARGNIPSFSTYQSDLVGYEAARIGLGDELIDVFSVGTGYSRGELDSDRITIDAGVWTPSQAVFENLHVYVKTGNTFEKRMLPAVIADAEFEIRTFAKNNRKHSMIASRLAEALGTRKYLTVDPGLFVDKLTLLCEFVSSVNVTSADWIEIRYQYILHELPIIESAEVANSIPELTTFTNNITPL